MILESIRVVNFLSHKSSYVDFTASPLWLMYGENGSGKSALFEAYQYALYGSHRGGSQGAKNLVKQGEEQGHVEVIFSLDGIRYRLVQHLDAVRGNLGGQLAQWDQATNQWKTVPTVNGRDGVWEWLAPRLPPADLFNSAIFLRQGETAHFLSGTAKDRNQRFAALIDLNQYTTLAKLAKGHEEGAQEKVRTAEAKRSILGDVSDTALQRLQASLEATSQEYERHHTQHEQAILVVQDAAEWQRLLGERGQLEQQRESILQLQANAPAIRDAAQRVTRWDRTKPELDRYWNEYQRALRYQSEMQTAREAAEEADKHHTECTAHLQEKQERHAVIQTSELPAARIGHTTAQANTQALNLEVKIAELCDSARQTEQEVARLEGKEQELAEWQTRQGALSALRGVIAAQQEQEQARGSLQEAQSALGSAEQRLIHARQEVEKAAEQEKYYEGEFNKADLEVQRLNEQIAALTGRIEGRSRLEGTEYECPVCGQPLDEQAHTHVREVLADERASLSTIQAERAKKGELFEAARDVHEKARLKCQEKETARQQAEQTVVLSKRDLEYKTQLLQTADERLTEARRHIIETYPIYVPQIDAVTPGWIGEEEQRITQQLDILQVEVNDLIAARGRLQQAEIALEFHRNMRESSTTPLGETEPISVLQAQLAHVEEEARKQSHYVEDLEQEERDLQKAILQLSNQVATFGEKMNNEQRRAANAAQEAAEAERQAKQIYTALGIDWAEILDSRDAYEVEQQTVAQERELAEQLSALEQAQGQLHIIEGQLGDNAQAMERIDPSHRISVDEARRREEEARRAVLEANTLKAQAQRDIDDLKQRQQDAITYEQIINDAKQEAETYRELYDLLKEGGEIQNAVVVQEQEHILDEVNGVLDCLQDSLRVDLGAARRSRSAQSLDIQILDTSDPVGRPRYFDYLSGGEQFRIALALSLALHRRVAQGRPGTLIIDEGFGTLDGDRRDALAVQMTNTSQGILQLGLAERIIICSHSAEVNRRFSHRWLIRKQDGTASVLLLMSEDEVDSLLGEELNNQLVEVAREI